MKKFFKSIREWIASLIEVIVETPSDLHNAISLAQLPNTLRNFRRTLVGVTWVMVMGVLLAQGETVILYGLTLGEVSQAAWLQTDVIRFVGEAVVGGVLIISVVSLLAEILLRKHRQRAR